MRQTALFFKSDPDYGRRVAAGLGLDIAAVERLAAMSRRHTPAPPSREPSAEHGHRHRAPGFSLWGGSRPKSEAVPSLLPLA